MKKILVFVIKLVVTVVTVVATLFAAAIGAYCGCYLAQTDGGVKCQPVKEESNKEQDTVVLGFRSSKVE